MRGSITEAGHSTRTKQTLPPYFEPAPLVAEDSIFPPQGCTRDNSAVGSSPALDASQAPAVGSPDPAVGSPAVPPLCDEGRLNQIIDTQNFTQPSLCRKRPSDVDNQNGIG